MEAQQFNYEDIVRIGEDAARSLQSPVLGLSYRMAVEEITQKMFNCEPGHTKTMEELRRQGNSLAAVFGRLQHWVGAAEAELQKQHNAKAMPNQPDEYQGFGMGGQ
jgi:hypothetical protein